MKKSKSLFPYGIMNTIKYKRRKKQWIKVPLTQEGAMFFAFVVVIIIAAIVLLTKVYN